MRACYRLGLDLGATSVGWSIYDIQNDDIINTGVLIFDDGRDARTKASLCVQRRNARSLRRIINRQHEKMQLLIKKLAEIGLLPPKKEEQQALKKLNPYTKQKSIDSTEMEDIKKRRHIPIYALRAESLYKKIEPYHFGRILLQLAQRKGFRSNRKNNMQEGGGKLKDGNRQLNIDMDKIKANTYGEYLYKKYIADSTQALRLKNKFKDGKFTGGHFPFRDNYEKEFDKIWDKQKEYYPDILNDKNRTTIKNIIYHQRPLKEQEVGWCYLEEREKRIPKAHPLFQEFRILQHVNNLEFYPQNSIECCIKLDEEHRKQLIDLLQTSDDTRIKNGTLSYQNIKKKFKNLKGDFNYESSSNNTSEKGILVNKTQFEINKHTCLKNVWNNLIKKEQCEIINILFNPSNYVYNYRQARTADEQDNKIKQHLAISYSMPEEAIEQYIHK